MRFAAQNNSRPSKARRRSIRRAARCAIEPLDHRLLLSAAIPANASLTSDFIVSGESFGITKFTVDLDATFANDSNLSATLTSPAGKTVQLFKNPAAESNFTATVFDDSAPQVINQVAVPSFTGAFQPQSPLSKFNGENPNGNWKLTITNNSPSLKGVLNGWSVIPIDQDPSTGAYVIPNGQTAPNAVNATDFGATAASVFRQYTITNTPSGMLIEGSITPVSASPFAGGSTPTSSISGPNAGDFAIIDTPVFPSALGASSSFHVAFTPTAAGARSATITLQGSGPAGPTLRFAIGGTGIPQGTIQVAQPNPYASNLMTVAITNTGLGTLQLTQSPLISGITISDPYGDVLYPSPDPAMNQTLTSQFNQLPPFTLVNAYPAALASGETYDLNISFDPNIAAYDFRQYFNFGDFLDDRILVSPDITIDSSDPARPSITFPLSTYSQLVGSGDGPPQMGEARMPAIFQNPELPFSVSQGNNPLSDAQTIDIGNVLEGNNAVQQTLSLSNNGFDTLLYSLSTSGSGFTASTMTNSVSSGEAASILISPSTGSLQSINGSIQLFVTDMQTNIEEGFTLYVDGQVVAPLTPPAFTSAPSATFTIGAPNSFTITTSGSPAPGLSCSTSLPGGLKFKDNGDGTATLSGSPTAAAGVYTLQLSAANGGGSAAAQSFKLTLAQPIKITSINHAAFQAGKSNAFALTATASPSANITRSGTLPTGITFNPKTNTLSGTPTPAAGGTYLLTFTAANGVGTPFIQSFTLTVNAAPQFTSLNNTAFTVGTANSFNILTGGFPGATVTAPGTLPKGITLNKSGQLVGTPTTAGTFKFTLTATNSVAIATQAFTLTVIQPTAFTSKNTATFKHGQSGSFTVATTGFPAATLTDFTPTAGLTFTPAANGTALLTISKSLPAGTYNLIFTATPSSGARLLQLFTLIVN